MSNPGTIANRMQLMLSSGAGADVHFLVGQSDEKELFPAHKTILMAASDVFTTMFHFDAENAAVGTVNNPVVVTDVDVGAFKAMLGFIYADDLSGLNGDNALAVLFAAKKYNVIGLVKACLDIPVLELGDVFATFAATRLLGEEDVAARCLKHIVEHADTLIRSEEFLEIDQKLLCEILDQNLRVGKEMTVWENALRWADAQCRENGMECTGANRRAVLGLAVHKIRFPRLSREDFADKIVPSGVLTHEELVSVFLYHQRPNGHNHSEMFPPKFSTENRAEFDGPRRAKGRLTMKIENFSDFAGRCGNFLCGDAVYIRGIPWQLCAEVTLSKKRKNTKIEFYFRHGTDGRDHGDAQQHDDGSDPVYCSCRATFWILSQIVDLFNYSRSIAGTYDSDSSNNELKCFVMYEYLINSAYGLYREDTVTLGVDLSVELL